jgi:hypothetical protein
MPRVRHRDTPEYAADIIEGTKPISSQLAVAAGLLSMLLVAMSTMEAPLTRQDFPINGTGEMQASPADELGLLCSIGGKLVSWIAVEAS